MRQIIYDASKVRVFKYVQEFCDCFGKSENWRTVFWMNLLDNIEVYTEFVYFLEHKEFLAQYKIEGYSIIDIFVWHIDQFSLKMDTGKNDEQCNKIKLVLESFDFMLKMKKDKKQYLRKLQSDMGRDQ